MNRHSISSPRRKKNSSIKYVPLNTTYKQGLKDESEDRPGAVYKIKCFNCQAIYIGETGSRRPQQQHRQTPLNPLSAT